MLLTHLRVRHWSLSTLRKIQNDWTLFRKAVTCPLYATPMEDNPLWEKFVTKMGWRNTNQLVLCHDGIERPLFIHTV